LDHGEDVAAQRFSQILDPDAPLSFEKSRLSLPNRHDSANTDDQRHRRFDVAGPKVTIELLDELVRLGLTNEAFRRLHHSQRETIHGFRQWYLKTSSFVAGGNNERVHERLKYVMTEYRVRGLPPGETDVLVELAAKAFVKIPPIPTGHRGVSMQ
jgi:hypothetical protein